ncbi:hypothetical protein D9C73_005420 [Collichthys lucidus]|uniref:MyoD family inhibitor domain-containing protein 2 n=1 Tax=Collichthys lucidus TaxID=240159 RepID=A0A4U5UB24_COLLU|nr:hypothetical protein D9C73_005420 [Collichthys lucidus]
MDQMADEMTLRADVKDKRRVNTVEESSTLVGGENTQSEAQVSDWRLGSSAETEPGETSRDADAQRPRECDSSSPLFSLKRYLRRSSSATFSSSSTDSLSSSQPSNTGVDCAEIVLNCLFCRFFYSCERVANHCCPNYKQVVTTPESPSSSDDYCTNVDCGFFNPGQDASDCLELAMEISEICYH